MLILLRKETFIVLTRRTHSIVLNLDTLTKIIIFFRSREYLASELITKSFTNNVVNRNSSPRLKTDFLTKYAPQRRRCRESQPSLV